MKRTGGMASRRFLGDPPLIRTRCVASSRFLGDQLIVAHDFPADRNIRNSLLRHTTDFGRNLMMLLRSILLLNIYFLVKYKK
mmetsp:Transcript_15255/g.30396  ORF Transcript_15255/g.30396 Transcript_15255/m.30396 type:complete len:82 (+) Transcript_15255:428-673(+)